MVQITIDSTRIDDIKNRLDQLVQNGLKVESGQLGHENHIRRKLEPLDKIELDIQEYVKNNPGTSKQGVVDNLNYARVTIYRAIKRLVNYRIIIVELDKKSKRKHRLYVNDRSVITTVMADIKGFKRSYLNLIKRAEKIYKNVRGRDDDELYSWMISGNLIFILKHLITSYSLYAVFEWPNSVKDTEGLNRLYLTVFQNLNELFSELANHVPFHLSGGDERMEFLKKDLMFLFQESKIYENLIRDFHEYDLDKDMDSVMSKLFIASKMPREWKDFRAAIVE